MVKNVAGYDLMKLQIGALGTLGVVTQLTLKVKPKPEASEAVVFGCDSASLAAVLGYAGSVEDSPGRGGVVESKRLANGGEELLKYRGRLDSARCV